jgi:hypothetical protein
MLSLLVSSLMYLQTIPARNDYVILITASPQTKSYVNSRYFSIGGRSLVDPTILVTLRSRTRWCLSCWAVQRHDWYPPLLAVPHWNVLAERLLLQALPCELNH